MYLTTSYLQHYQNLFMNLSKILKKEFSHFADPQIELFNYNHKTIVNKNGNTYLVSNNISENGVFSNGQYLYKEKLPEDSFLTAIRHPLKDKQVKSFLGEDTEYMYKKDVLGIKEEANPISEMYDYHNPSSPPIAKRYYSFFTVNESNALVKMQIFLEYTFSEKGEGVVKEIYWSREVTNILIEDEKSNWQRMKKEAELPLLEKTETIGNSVLDQGIK